MAINADFATTCQVCCSSQTSNSETDDSTGLVVKSNLTLPKDHTGRTMSLLVDGHIKATFAAGVVPVEVEDLYYSKEGLRVEHVETAIILKWYVRNIETQDGVTAEW